MELNYKILQEGPTTIFPIDYSQAILVIGENGKITETIIPNDYDIGTVAMANGQWIVQYEYQESYLETIENDIKLNIMHLLIGQSLSYRLCLSSLLRSF